MRSLYTAGPLAALAVFAAGCTVYVPVVPATPLLEYKQVEITTNLNSNPAVDASMAWSPLPHLLLTGEAAVQVGGGTTTSKNVTYEDYHRQVGLGLGVYRAFTEQSPWYLAAVGGVGFAKVNLYTVDVDVLSVYVPLPVSYVTGLYDVAYRRYYGQLYAARALEEGLACGFSVRGTYVDYTRFTYQGQPIMPANHFFLEPTLFVRVGSGVLRGQAAIGLSLPLRHEASRDFTKRTAQMSTLFSAGLVLRPDQIRWLKRK